jgi:hypothetical protein
MGNGKNLPFNIVTYYLKNFHKNVKLLTDIFAEFVKISGFPE